MDEAKLKRLRFGRLVQINQTLLQIFCSPLYKRVFRIRGRVDPALLTIQRQRIIIVSNHTRKRDPFDMLSTLPYSVAQQILPIRFFTANRFFHTWSARILLILLGCFRAYKVEGIISGVKGGLVFSDQRETLWIFPQGRIEKQKITGDLKEGIAYLVKHRQFLIIPIQITPPVSPNSWRTITWGKPFMLSDAERQQDFTTLTKHIFAQVLSLEEGSA